MTVAPSSAIIQPFQDPFFMCCDLFTLDELMVNIPKISSVCQTWKEWMNEWSRKLLNEFNVRVLSREAIEEKLKQALAPEDFAKLSFRRIPETTDFRVALVKGVKFFEFYERIKTAGTAVEGKQGLTIVFGPRGITLEMLKKAYPRRIESIAPNILERLGKDETEGLPFIITSNVLENTRGKSHVDQRGVCLKTGGDLPEVWDFAFYATMVQEIFPISSLPEESPIYTRCAENLNDQPVVAGGLPSKGIDITHHADNPNDGAVAVMKLRR